MSVATVTLADSFEECRKLNRKHGTTYYWSTLVLPKAKQPYVHALYGFCRYADEIVDDLGSTATVDQKARQLAEFGEQFFVDLERGDSDHPVLKAVVNTVVVNKIDPDCFRRFLRSMTMDLTVTTYETYADLEHYMDGSAAVIGEMMLPVLDPVSPAALTHARDLGNAFQLTNFLRDIAEDLDRDRQYIPQEDLRRFGVTLTDRTCTPAFVELMKFEIDRCNVLYRSADIGLGMLPPVSRRCIGSARVLYSRILDKIVEQHYDVFSGRARVPMAQKLWIVARSTVPVLLTRNR
jgi:15-cis-phytoene synthase